MAENLEEYMTADQLFDWAKASMKIVKLNADMTEDDFQRAMKWIGMCSVDTIYINGGKPKLGRIGIGLMLFVTLMEFPNLYAEYRLAQWN